MNLIKANKMKIQLSFMLITIKNNRNKRKFQLPITFHKIIQKILLTIKYQIIYTITEQKIMNGTYQMIMNGEFKIKIINLLNKKKNSVIQINT